MVDAGFGDYQTAMPDTYKTRSDLHWLNHVNVQPAVWERSLAREGSPCAPVSTAPAWLSHAHCRYQQPEPLGQPACNEVPGHNQEHRLARHDRAAKDTTGHSHGRPSAH